MIGQSGPFFNVKADVISKNLALISGKYCNIFSHFPNLLELNIIAWQNGVLNLDSFLRNWFKQILKLFTWRLNKKQMISLLHILKNIWLEVFFDHHIRVAFHVLKSIELLTEFLFDNWDHFKNVVKIFCLDTHDSAVLVKFLAVNV